MATIKELEARVRELELQIQVLELQLQLERSKPAQVIPYYPPVNPAPAWPLQPQNPFPIVTWTGKAIKCSDNSYEITS